MGGNKKEGRVGSGGWEGRGEEGKERVGKGKGKGGKGEGRKGRLLPVMKLSYFRPWAVRHLEF